MRYCSRCRTELIESNIVYRDKLHKRPRSECKDCFSKIQSEQQQKRKVKLIELKGGCCSICGYNKCNGALEFHHLDETKKEFGLSKIMSWENTLLELDKCILVCSNCHRELHYVSTN